MAIFETDRFVVRRLTKEDAPSMFAIYGDPENVVYVGDGEPITLEECLQWVDVTDANFARRGYGMVAAEDRTSGRILACLGIVHPDQQEEPEVKYAVLRSEWGRGFATELVGAIANYGFETLGLPYLTATVHPENEKSQKVMTKCGFSLREVRVDEDGFPVQVWERRKGPEPA